MRDLFGDRVKRLAIEVPTNVGATVLRSFANRLMVMALRTVFVGIDVACSRAKRLPICFASLDRGRLSPIAVPTEFRRRLPLGLGNGEVLQPLPFRAPAEEVAAILGELEKECGWSIRRIAIDAPAARPIRGVRRCERELIAAGLSCFRTPDRSRWKEIALDCGKHVQSGKPLNRLPYANIIWMLYGFELFHALRESLGVQVIEVYPYAIARSLLNDGFKHKSTKDGYEQQLTAIAQETRWHPGGLRWALAASVSGSPHDKLDAFMAAWVGSLEPRSRHAYGIAEDMDDSIWVPNLSVPRSP